MNYDIAVIGGGPGGYVSAIRAAQLGAKVLLAEKEELGGVCLRKGCIPTKTLLKSAEKWKDLLHCRDFGLYAESVSFNYPSITMRMHQVIEQLQKGISQLLKSYKQIDVKFGTAMLQKDGRMAICSLSGHEHYTAQKTVIATGSLPMKLPVPGGDSANVISSDELLSMQTIPESIVIVGAGAVGLEFASILHTLGCKVTVIEAMAAILPNADDELVKRLGPLLRKQGITVMAYSKVTSIVEQGDGLTVCAEDSKGQQITLKADKVLAAIGREPQVSGFGLENLGIQYHKKGILVNHRMETTLEGVYAIGDVTGRHMLAHVASAEGIVAAENALGGNSQMDYSAVPSCVFTTPEIAMVGLTEREAASRDRAVRISKFNFAANSKAVSMKESDGFVKMVADDASGKIIGMHILGPHASDLIMEGALAIRNGLTAQQVAHTIHPHPSLSETIMECASGIKGEIIHQARSKS